jgi:hypothetical protein
LSFAEQRRLDEYNREREAMEAATSVKGNLPGEDKEKHLRPLRSAASDSIRPHQCPFRAGGQLRKAAFPNPPVRSSPQAGQPEQRTDYERQNDQEQKAGFGQQHGKQEIGIPDCDTETCPGPV